MFSMVGPLVKFQASMYKIKEILAPRKIFFLSNAIFSAKLTKIWPIFTKKILIDRKTSNPIEIRNVILFKRLNHC